MDILFTYPAWLILLCVIAGVAYSTVFYRKDKALDETPQWLIYLMALARFVVVTVLAILLLKPLIRSEAQTIEKPIVVIAQDNSESVAFGKDSAFYQSDYQQKLNQLVTDLSDDYEVKTFSFGDEVSDSLLFTFDQKQTDFEQLLNEIESRFYGRNLGAVILASDGLYNKGANPLYAGKFINATTIYTIALGDTAKKKDLAILNVAHNKLAYFGNDFPVEVVVKSDYLQNNVCKISILKGGQTIASETRSINSDNQIITVPFKIEAKNVGKQIYTVKIDPLEGEFTTINNAQEIFIEVLDNKQKIMIVSASPHPDIAALKWAIEKNINYETDVVSMDDYKGGLEGYSLVILHQIPSVNGGEQKLLGDIEKFKIPSLYILGEQSNLAAFNEQKLGVTVVGPKGFTDVKPVLNAGFTNFTIDDQVKQLLPVLPPIQIPFASDYKLTNAVNVLLYQKVGSTTTNFPLMGFNTQHEPKVGFVLGEGIWRWKFQDFLKNSSNTAFETLKSKVIQFLAVKEDKSKFRVSSENEFPENEYVIFNAELYNDIYELVNDSEVSLLITDKEGKEYPARNFTKVGQSYRLDAGMFAPGQYEYKALTSYNGKNYEVTGEFVVRALKVEFSNTVADFSLMYNLADKTGGKLFTKDDFQEIPAHLNQNNKIASVSYVNQELTDVIKWKWILILILSLLTLEWFLRKRYGAY